MSNHGLSRKVAVLTGLVILLGAVPLLASQPASGTLTASSTAAISFTGSAVGGASADAENTCVEGVNCDTFLLTVGGTPADWNGKNVKVSLSWLLPATDYDLYIHKTDAAGPVVASSAQGTNTAEAAEINIAQNGTGTYAVHVVYFVAIGDQYQGRAEVATAQADNPPPLSTITPPTYAAFAAPATLGQSAGEPTIGLNWATGNAMFIAGLETLRISFNDAAGTASWVDRSGLTTSITTFDPILFT